MRLNRLIRLGLYNVAKNPDAKTLEVADVGIVKERLEDGTFTEKIVNYTIDCCVNRGDILKVKFEPHVSKKYEVLKARLDAGEYIEISFTDLVLTPYAMQLRDGSGIISGVSGKAADFEIVETDAMIEL